MCRFVGVVFVGEFIARVRNNLNIFCVMLSSLHVFWFLETKRV